MIRRLPPYHARKTATSHQRDKDEAIGQTREKKREIKKRRRQRRRRQYASPCYSTFPRGAVRLAHTGTQPLCAELRRLFLRFVARRRQRRTGVFFRSRGTRHSIMTSTGVTSQPDEELEKRRDEEYQMQLFGLHSRTVYAAIKEKIQENVDSRCHKIYSSIEKIYKPDDRKKEILKSNIKQLRKAYLHNMQPHLSIIENIVNKFICVPNNVLLEDDKCQAIQYSDEEFYNLEKKLEHLQQQAKRVTIANAALQKELEITERIKESEDLAKELCAIIDKGLAGKKLSTKTLRAIEKWQGLEESLDSLKLETQKDIYNPRLDESELESICLL